MVEAMLLEGAREATTTRRLLARVPHDQLAWTPQATSMSLGQLARHVAVAPGQMAALGRQDAVQVREFASRPSATSTAAAVETLERSLREAQQVWQGMDDQRAMSSWTVVRGAKPRFAAPKIAVARSMLLNHWYHHRGPLSVYLRRLEVPRPSIDGPSADEHPFAREGGRSPRVAPACVIAVSSKGSTLAAQRQGVSRGDHLVMHGAVRLRPLLCSGPIDPEAA